VSEANGAVRTSLVDGKNNSRAGEATDTEQSTLTDHLDLDDRDDRPDEDGRYDCREVYRNMDLEADDGETAAFRCNSWDCYCCAHRMRMNLIESLEELVDERPEMRRLLTITVAPETAPSSTSAQHEHITDRWNALRTEINDRYPGLSYVWIRHEGDENGRPHLHLLVDRYLPQEALSVMSERVGLGPVVDIRRVNARNAAKYLTSYLGKGALAMLPNGLRRYGSSSDVDLSVRGGGDDDRDWRLMMDDHEIRRRSTDEPLRREVTKTDLYVQKVRGGPVGLDPPDR
jgi:hypothetical protein